MKRVGAAAFLLGIIICFIVWGTGFVTVSANEFSRYLENGVAAYKVRDYSQAAEQIKLLTDKYDRKNGLLRVFVHRELLEAIRQNIKGLPAFFEADSPEDFIYTSRLLQAQLETMERLFFVAF